MANTSERFDELLADFLEGAGSEEASREFMALMTGNPERIRRYLDVMEVHAMLKCCGALGSKQDVANCRVGTPRREAQAALRHPLLFGTWRRKASAIAAAVLVAALGVAATWRAGVFAGASSGVHPHGADVPPGTDDALTSTTPEAVAEDDEDGLDFHEILGTGVDKPPLNSIVMSNNEQTLAAVPQGAALTPKEIPMRTSQITGMVAAVTWAVLGQSAFADTASTIGYWRFENGGSLGTDSGPNALSLTVVGTVESIGVGSGFGAGSGFPSVIPLTRTANPLGVRHTGGNAYFSRSDSDALFISSAVTAEVFFNITSFTASGNTPFVGQWNKDSTYNQRSWLLCARSGKLRFCTSSDGGTDIIQKDSSLTVAVGVDYYAAAVYNAGTVTFYLKDLSNPNNPLQSQTVAGYSPSLHDSTRYFYIGAYKEAQSYSYQGVMDEVRVSNTALEKSELLITSAPGQTVVIVR